ncbi:MAG: RelA/SpoT family protein [Patescibacteria group bacterium]
MTWDEYQNTLKELGYSFGDILAIKPAFEFAQETHKNEKRMSGEPYFTHPVSVSLHVAQLKLDADAISASLLHDVVENQGIKIETIKKRFGDEVAFLVEAVTKVDSVHYKGVEREVESLRKMFLALAQDIRVVIIKLMDRLHNMETLEFQAPKKQQRIAEETLELYAPLADRLGIWEIKAKLEDLAFPFVNPQKYIWLKSQVESQRKHGKELLEKLRPRVEYELKKEGVKTEKILYRTKHLYSIWKKLLKYEMDFDRILDIVAMRIIVNNIADCYKTLGVIHKLWKPVPGRIKDFIALPKPNGYQSLHTTVFGPEKRIVDFQIRTTDMHKEAEFGIAAHWAYDESGKKKTVTKINDKKIEWVSRFQKWYQEHKNFPTKDLLLDLKIDFFKDRIFALTPKGDVIDLPDGASPIDFAYHIHSEVGDRMFGAKVNGKMAQFSTILKSGDTVEILTQKNKKPTADWLNHTKTSLARNKIRSFLKKRGQKPQEISETLEITVTAKDRVGILKECSEVFYRFKVNIDDLKTDFKDKKYPKLIFSCKEPGSNSYKILSSLKKIRGILNVAARSSPR